MVCNAEQTCPNCGSEMEPIDIAVEGLALEQLRLCPRCYLVAWNDEKGMQTRQGVPVRENADLSGKPKKGEC
jgi:hypothetical protein